MLINSSVAKGKCPVCGTANCACGGPSNVTAVDERMEVAAMSGKMVKVPTGRPGVSVQMYEAEAIRRGLLPAPKKQEPVLNKKRPPARNK